jgi:hypothetical protein
MRSLTLLVNCTLIVGCGARTQLPDTGVDSPTVDASSDGSNGNTDANDATSRSNFDAASDSCTCAPDGRLAEQPVNSCGGAVSISCMYVTCDGGCGEGLLTCLEDDGVQEWIINYGEECCFCPPTGDTPKCGPC